MDILILSGFLGSGKTSLLIALADELVRRNPERSIAVLENETGTVGIDDKVLAGEGLQVRELTSGCVCCTLKGELLATTLEIQQQINPGLLIVEASGVAAPRIVAEAFTGYPEKLDSITLAVLLDLTRLDVLTGYSSYYVQGCINSADVLILNKLDAVEHDVLESALNDTEKVKAGVLTIPVSCHDKTGIPAVADAVGARADSTGLQSYDAAGKQDKISGVATYAHLCEVEWPQKADSAVVAAQLQEMVQGVAADLKPAGCALIGHIKALLKVEGESCLVRTVTFDGTPDVQNSLAGSLDSGELIVNAIVYGVEKHEVEEIVGTRLQQFMP